MRLAYHQGNKVDVIVVMGAAVRQGGLPSPALTHRVLHAVALFHRGVTEHLLFTGGIGNHPPSEASVMKQLALDKGVPENCIVLEETATNTLESAIACVPIIRRRNWLTVLIVTDHYHLFRTRMAFQAVGIKATGSFPGTREKETVWWRWYFNYVREVIAVLWYMVRIVALQMQHR
jgi:uncharacterized SAM-binding protein YcdF (DUF218 family)